MARLPQSSGGGNILFELVKNARLAWRLLMDKRVAPWLKAIPVATLIYLLSPIDLLPDALPGLGQLDDIGLILLGLMFFIKMCPQEVVSQHLRELTPLRSSGHGPNGKPAEDEYIDAPYRIINDEENS